MAVSNSMIPGEGVNVSMVDVGETCKELPNQVRALQRRYIPRSNDHEDTAVQLPDKPRHRTTTIWFPLTILSSHDGHSTKQDISHDAILLRGNEEPVRVLVHDLEQNPYREEHHVHVQLAKQELPPTRLR